MLKFMAGLGIGILFCTLFRIADTGDRIVCGVVGALLGAAVLFVALMFFLGGNKAQEKKPWWKNGDKPPWEREEYNPYEDNSD